MVRNSIRQGQTIDLPPAHAAQRAGSHALGHLIDQSPCQTTNNWELSKTL
jgi:hypothetical protein